MRLAHTPFNENDSQGIHEKNGLRVCANAEPRKLPTIYGNRPRGSARSLKVSTKPSVIQNIHRHGKSSKNQIVTVVQPVFLSALVDQLTGFVQVSIIAMLQHIFTFYRAMGEMRYK